MTYVVAQIPFKCVSKGSDESSPIATDSKSFVSICRSDVVLLATLGCRYVVSRLSAERSTLYLRSVIGSESIIPDTTPMNAHKDELLVVDIDNTLK